MTPLRTTVEVIDALGGNVAVGQLTGRDNKAVWNWRRFETFPADTFVVMTDELARKGYAAPSTLWRQVQPVHHVGERRTA